MNRCKTCRHWQPEAADESVWLRADCTKLRAEEYYQLGAPMTARILIGAGTCRRYYRARDDCRILGFRVGNCANPKIPFMSVPPKDGAIIFDGSGYAGSFSPAEDFGCVLHEEEE